MNYCIRNININEYPKFTNVGELMLDGTLFSPSELIDVSKDNEVRMVYDLSNVKNIKEIIVDLLDLPKVIPSLAFRVKNLDDLEILLAKELPVFCSPSAAANADSLDKMVSLCEKGVTDVYVAGQLGFDMKSARFIADKFSVNIRIIPNMATLSGFSLSHIGEEENITAFWVRPDDIDLYEDYVDIVEFYGEDAKQHTFYEVYAIDKQWLGELGFLIVGLNDINNKGLIEDFTSARLNCGKKCMLNKCHSCFKYKAMAKTIVENKLRIEL